MIQTKRLVTKVASLFGSAREATYLLRPWPQRRFVLFYHALDANIDSTLVKLADAAAWL